MLDGHKTIHCLRSPLGLAWRHPQSKIKPRVIFKTEALKRTPILWEPTKKPKAVCVPTYRPICSVSSVSPWPWCLSRQALLAHTSEHTYSGAAGPPGATGPPVHLYKLYSRPGQLYSRPGQIYSKSQQLYIRSGLLYSRSGQLYSRKREL